MTQQIVLPSPPDGWQLDGCGPTVYPIGEDGDVFLAFGQWPEEVFFRSAVAYLEHLGYVSIELHDLSIDSVKKRTVEYIDDEERVQERGWNSWGVDWSSEADATIPVMMLTF